MHWLFTHFMIEFSWFNQLERHVQGMISRPWNKTCWFLQILRWNLRAVSADCQRGKRNTVLNYPYCQRVVVNMNL